MNRNSSYQFPSFGTQSLQNPPGYSSIRKRRKRRSKYDVSYIYETSGTTRAYFDYRPGKTKFYNPPDLDNLASDPSLNLRPQKDRTVFTDKQMLILEAAYQKNKKPDPKRREMVAELCELPLERVRIWYQNRRAKEKRVEIDELAALAKRFCSNDGDYRRTSLCDSLSTINRHINRIFDHDDTVGEEDVIKKIIKHELYGQDMHHEKQTQDRWSHYRGSNCSRSSANTHTSEKELIRSFLRKDANPVNAVCSKIASNEPSSSGRKRKRYSNDTADRRSPQYDRCNSYEEDSTYLRQQLINKQFLGLTNNGLESRPGNEVTSFTEVLHDSSRRQHSSNSTLSRASRVPLEEALDQEQLYLLHLLNQRQWLSNYQNTLKEHSTKNIHYAELGSSHGLSPQYDLHNAYYGRGNEQNTSARTWIDFLNDEQSKLPPLVDVFEQQLIATNNMTYGGFQKNPKDGNIGPNKESVRPKSSKRLKKFTEQDARDYEITRKIYEEEMRLGRS